MARIIFSIGSVTFSIKAKKLLARIGVNASVVKVNPSKTTRGCTHGIEFEEVDLLRVVMELKRNGIAYERYVDKKNA